MLKIVLYLILFILIFLIIFNLSSFNIPTDKILYNQSKSYFLESEERFGLPPYEQNDIGMGMTGYHNQVILLKDVQPALAFLMSEMNKAKKNINIEFFIIRDDHIGNQFKDLLIKKAKEGVEVLLLYDHFGSFLTPSSYFNEMRKKGVKVTAYNPLFPGILEGRLANRLHRKMIIIDGEKAFIGGKNIGDEYLGRDKKIGFWKDTGVYFIGDAALSVQQIFFVDWLQSTGERLMDKSFYPEITSIDNQKVQIIIGGPDSPLTDMNLPYIRLINQAKSKIIMESPYFFPDRHLLNALYQAAVEKVDIHLLLPRKSDNWIANMIQPIYIRNLLKHGITVSTYDIGFIHSKVMIIDDEAASVGTTNYEPLSFFKSYEVNSILYDKKIIKELKNDFSQDLKKSTTYLPGGNYPNK